jgi:SPP1 gp7 family putative phage head morphogenesis protein
LEVTAVRPNAGLEAVYRKKLRDMIESMHESVIYWLSVEFKRNEPAIAADALPAAELRKAIRELAVRWQRQFNELAPALGKWFALSASKRSDKSLARILDKGGMSVKFRMSRAQRDILRATIIENVGLIKSIPQQYLKSVETHVMQSVQTGRDLEQLTKDLRDSFGVTKRRAELIARDQNNKATSALTRARQLELGITRALWVHSFGGKHPRRSHIKNDGKEYDVAKGWWDPDEKKFIHPGHLINCRCVSRPVIPGFMVSNPSPSTMKVKKAAEARAK